LPATPLPDETGRGKLARLYGNGLPLVDAVVAEAADAARARVARSSRN